jgi:lipoprotein NlpI
MARILRCAYARLSVLVAAALLLASTALPVPAGTLKDWKCTGNPDVPWDEQIVGCTNALKSGRFTGHSAAVAHNDRGDVYQAMGDFDRAIADYDQAIALDPKYAGAYYNRGNTYQAKGDFDRAIADYTEAIQLNPKYFASYNNRGMAYQAKGDLDRALSDYSDAIRLDPKSATPYLNRGIANLYAGSLAKALADLTQSSALGPKYAYAALWVDIADKRSNLPSQLAEASKQIDMTKWPAPVIRLYLGQLTAEAVLAAADDPNANTKNGQLCEANFYTGELALQRGDKDDATRLFKLAAGACLKTFTEWLAANAELKALGDQP